MKSKIALYLVGLLLSNIALAGEYSGTITGIGVGQYYDDKCAGSNSCVVIMVENHHPKSGCRTDSWAYAFDASTDTGKNTLSLVLAAELSGQKVVIGGTGQCTVKASSEDVKYIYHKKW